MTRSRLWLLPLLLAVLVGGGWYFSYRAQSSDRELPVYVRGGERMAAGETIYRRGSEDKPFTYPPFAAVPFVPFAKLPADWQPPAWFVVNFAIVLALVRWLHGYARRELPGLAPPRLAWFWVLTLLLGGRHVLSVFTNQSHDLLILGLMTLLAAAWLRSRTTAALWAGLGAATKATPLLAIGLFVLRRRALAATLLLVVVAAATLLPDWLFPLRDGTPWWRAWYEVNLRGLEVGGAASADGAWNAHSVLNQSLSGTLTRLFTPVVTPAASFVVGQQGEVLLVALPGWAFRVVALVAQLAVLGLITLGVLAAHRRVRAAADAKVAQGLVGLGEVAAIACGMVLLSPQSSKSHFCVWLLPAAYLAERLLRCGRDRVTWALVISALIVTSLAKDLVGKQLGNLVLAYGNVTWATVLLLVATVRCLCRTRVTS
ncbi:MAG: DUF2029 domain-containing protein [Planctomycetes bacterium]|nr:DUF2029 domain-containing protein [Planctomycetota bacterium]